jgi:ATP phosphoribosyltransferase regulatory subunit
MRAEAPVPDDQLAAIRAPFLAAGAEPVDTPILQPLNLLLDLAGEAMRARLFVVQAEGGAEACLRPDFTVPVARLHLDRGAASGRYLYEGRVFRASAEDDRDEEVLQIGLERYDLGGAAPAADAEIVALAWRAAAAGGRQDLTLWLGDIALFAAFVDALDLAPALAARLKRAAARPRLLQAELARAGQGTGEAVAAGGLADILAGLAPKDAGRMLEEVWTLAGIEPVGGRGPAEIAERLIRRAEAARAPALTSAQAEAIGRFLTIEAAPSEALAAVAALAGPKAKALKAALGDWTTRLGELSHAGVPVSHARFATALGHDFDYYDGLTFEIRSDALGADRPVAVGGRYDGLPGRLGGPVEARAVGCMVRPRRAALETQAQETQG